MVNVKAHAKELWANARERWRDGNETRGILWLTCGLIIAIPTFLAAYLLLLPGLYVMIGAWAIHQVWEGFPAFGYWYSVVIVVALRIVAWTLGWFLRWIIISVTGGAE
jgi:hypothetical protein